LEPEVAVEVTEELTVEAHFMIAERLVALPLEVPDAHLTPVGGGHFADQEFIEGGPGIKGGIEQVQQFVKTIAGFSIKKQGARQRTVTGTVTGGESFAFRSFGASGAGSIGAGGGDLLVGRHLENFLDHIMRAAVVN
jgi:hypothetical protein